MIPKDSLDTLSNSFVHADSFVWLIILLASILVITTFIILVRRKQKRNKNNSASSIVKETSNVKNEVLENNHTETKPDTKQEQTVIRNKETERGLPKTVEQKVIVPPQAPKVEPPLPEPSKPKFIGYNPINLFEQTEPLKYPYVLMPKPNCVIKFPQKGRSGRKGYKEEDFKRYLTKYFANSFQLFDDRFILIKNSTTPFEPDFTLIDEKNGVNIFLDVEIDEPYEGINDVSKRRATHFQFADLNRNNAFKSRGWIVIRFAEIQVHQNPDSCCLFVADVIASIYRQFIVPNELLTRKKIAYVPQWSKEEAEKMSVEKYREKYLGIESFGLVAENSQITAAENKLGEETEKIVKDEPVKSAPLPVPQSSNPKGELINNAIRNRKYLSFIYSGSPTIVKPSNSADGVLNAYCYIKNTDRVFTVKNILNPVIKDHPFTLEATGPNLGLDRIITIVNTAIQYHKYIRMRYTRSSWTTMTVDKETGEVQLDVTEAEESIRTINNVQLAIDALDEEQLARYNLNQNYITAYCNRREEQRTFKFDRISELSILNL